MVKLSKKKKKTADGLLKQAADSPPRQQRRSGKVFFFLVMAITVFESYRQASSVKLLDWAKGDCSIINVIDRATNIEHGNQTDPPPTGTSSITTTIIEKVSDAPTPAPAVPVLEDKPRKIVLVHVGKAGGSTVRVGLAATCRRFFFRGTPEEVEVKRMKCMDAPRKSKIAGQTRDIFHMWAFNVTAIEQATTFLVTLRNPVDRVISAYKYHHPANCLKFDHPELDMKIDGVCVAVKGGKFEKGKPGYLLFNRCFPSPAIEDFAQSVIEPWRFNFHFKSENFTREERTQCRKEARKALEGRVKLGIVHHLEYGYEYYAKESIWKQPDKEVLGIRTEHEWEDIITLEKLLGGSGETASKEGSIQSHGSEYYYPSPISKQAYHKLCCVLEQEIDIYLDFLNRAINLDQAAKQESEDSLRQKCGVSSSWQEWRTDCRQRLEKSDPAKNPGAK